MDAVIEFKPYFVTAIFTATDGYTTEVWCRTSANIETELEDDVMEWFNWNNRSYAYRAIKVGADSTWSKWIPCPDPCRNDKDEEWKPGAQKK